MCSIFVGMAKQIVKVWTPPIHMFSASWDSLSAWAIWKWNFCWIGPEPLRICTALQVDWTCKKFQRPQIFVWTTKGLTLSRRFGWELILQGVFFFLKEQTDTSCLSCDGDKFLIVHIYGCSWCRLPTWEWPNTHFCKQEDKFLGATYLCLSLSSSPK